MHPQLSDKRIVCKEFIQALEECHSSAWRKFTGGCNKQKTELNHCLRTERVARSAHNREIAKERKEKVEKALKEFHDV